ncbi:thioesterase II family protein [Streptomyces sp. NPDC088560]|uniref:thioesterase II family protein n=1 Tax=Streptomyces sp. NPDC088560 TaxID=3365868 RepID=UPI00381FFBEA
MRPLTDTSRWLKLFHPDPAADIRVVCLPHAGGSATFWFPFSQALPRGVEALAVQYPGRQERHREPPLTRIDALADAITPLLDDGSGRAVALLGHSMGALIAFETAHQLRQRGAEPAALFVSARGAPSCPRTRPSVHRMAEEEIAWELRKLGGTDTRLLDDPEVLRLLLPTVRADYEAVETYAYRPRPPLECPVVAMVGDADPLVGTTEAEAWSKQTTGEFHLKVFPGGHFYLAEQQEALAAMVAEQIAGCRT